MARIEHSGVVRRVEGRTVSVEIVATSACGACSARSACGMKEEQTKIFDIACPEAEQFAAGDRVVVGIERKIGITAIILSYVIPLILLVSTLAVSLAVFDTGEGAALAATAAVMAAYYLCIYAARNKIEHTIGFTIKRE